MKRNKVQIHTFNTIERGQNGTIDRKYGVVKLMSGSIAVFELKQEADSYIGAGFIIKNLIKEAKQWAKDNNYIVEHGEWVDGRIKI